MPRVTFIQPDGIPVSVTAAVGESLMEIAISSGVEGILAECGGACACATCHVIPETGWEMALPPPEEFETLLLEGALNTEARSRLACQIPVTDRLDGITIVVPEGLI